MAEEDNNKIELTDKSNGTPPKSTLSPLVISFVEATINHEITRLNSKVVNKAERIKQKDNFNTTEKTINNKVESLQKALTASIASKPTDLSGLLNSSTNETMSITKAAAIQRGILGDYTLTETETLQNVTSTSNLYAIMLFDSTPGETDIKTLMKQLDDLTVTETNKNLNKIENDYLPKSGWGNKHQIKDGIFSSDSDEKLVIFKTKVKQSLTFLTQMQSLTAGIEEVSKIDISINDKTDIKKQLETIEVNIAEVTTKILAEANVNSNPKEQTAENIDLLEGLFKKVGDTKKEALSALQTNAADAFIRQINAVKVDSISNATSFTEASKAKERLEQALPSIEQISGLMTELKSSVEQAIKDKKADIDKALTTNNQKNKNALIEQVKGVSTETLDTASTIEEAKKEQTQLIAMLPSNKQIEALEETLQHEAKETRETKTSDINKALSDRVTALVKSEFYSLPFINFSNIETVSTAKETVKERIDKLTALKAQLLIDSSSIKEAKHFERIINSSMESLTKQLDEKLSAFERTKNGLLARVEEESSNNIHDSKSIKITKSKTEQVVNELNELKEVNLKTVAPEYTDEVNALIDSKIEALNEQCKKQVDALETAQKAVIDQVTQFDITGIKETSTIEDARKEKNALRDKVKELLNTDNLDPDLAAERETAVESKTAEINAAFNDHEAKFKNEQKIILTQIDEIQVDEKSTIHMASTITEADKEQKQLLAKLPSNEQIKALETTLQGPVKNARNAKSQAIKKAHTASVRSINTAITNTIIGEISAATAIDFSSINNISETKNTAKESREKVAALKAQLPKSGSKTTEMLIDDALKNLDKNLQKRIDGFETAEQTALAAVDAVNTDNLNNTTTVQATNESVGALVGALEGIRFEGVDTDAQAVIQQTIDEKIQAIKTKGADKVAGFEAAIEKAKEEAADAKFKEIIDEAKAPPDIKNKNSRTDVNTAYQAKNEKLNSTATTELIEKLHKDKQVNAKITQTQTSAQNITDRDKAIKGIDERLTAISTALDKSVTDTGLSSATSTPDLELGQGAFAERLKDLTTELGTFDNNDEQAEKARKQVTAFQQKIRQAVAAVSTYLEESEKIKTDFENTANELDDIKPPEIDVSLSVGQLEASEMSLDGQIKDLEEKLKTTTELKAPDIPEQAGVLGNTAELKDGPQAATEKAQKDAIAAINSKIEQLKTSKTNVQEATQKAKSAAMVNAIIKDITDATPTAKTSSEQLTQEKSTLNTNINARMTGPINEDDKQKITDALGEKNTAFDTAITTKQQSEQAAKIDFDTLIATAQQEPEINDSKINSKTEVETQYTNKQAPLAQDKIQPLLNRMNKTDKDNAENITLPDTTKKIASNQKEKFKVIDEKIAKVQPSIDESVAKSGFSTAVTKTELKTCKSKLSTHLDEIQKHLSTFDESDVEATKQSLADLNAKISLAVTNVSTYLDESKKFESTCQKVSLEVNTIKPPKINENSPLEALEAADATLDAHIRELEKKIGTTRDLKAPAIPDEAAKDLGNTQALTDGPQAQTEQAQKDAVRAITSKIYQFNNIKSKVKTQVTQLNKEQKSHDNADSIIKQIIDDLIDKDKKSIDLTTESNQFQSEYNTKINTEVTEQIDKDRIKPVLNSKMASFDAAIKNAQAREVKSKSEFDSLITKPTTMPLKSKSRTTTEKYFLAKLAIVNQAESLISKMSKKDAEASQAMADNAKPVIANNQVTALETIQNDVADINKKIDGINIDTEFAKLTIPEALESKQVTVNNQLDGLKNNLDGYDSGDKDPALNKIESKQTAMKEAVAVVSPYLKNLATQTSSIRNITNAANEIKIPEIELPKQSIEQLETLNVQIKEQIGSLHKLKNNLNGIDVRPVPDEANALGNHNAIAALQNTATLANKKTVEAIDKKIKELKEHQTTISQSINAKKEGYTQAQTELNTLIEKAKEAPKIDNKDSTEKTTEAYNEKKELLSDEKINDIIAKMDPNIQGKAKDKVAEAKANIETSNVKALETIQRKVMAINAAIGSFKKAQFAGKATSEDLNTKKDEVELALDAQADALKAFDSTDKDPVNQKIAEIKLTIDTAVPLVTTYLDNLKAQKTSIHDIAKQADNTLPVSLDNIDQKTIAELNRVAVEINEQIKALTTLKTNLSAISIEPVPDAANALGNKKNIEDGPQKEATTAQTAALADIDKKIENLNDLLPQVERAKQKVIVKNQVKAIQTKIDAIDIKSRFASCSTSQAVTITQESVIKELNTLNDELKDLNSDEATTARSDIEKKIKIVNDNAPVVSTHLDKLEKQTNSLINTTKVAKAVEIIDENALNDLAISKLTELETKINQQISDLQTQLATVTGVTFDAAPKAATELGNSAQNTGTLLPKATQEKIKATTAITTKMSELQTFQANISQRINAKKEGYAQAQTELKTLIADATDAPKIGNKKSTETTTKAFEAKEALLNAEKVDAIIAKMDPDSQKDARDQVAAAKASIETSNVKALKTIQENVGVIKAAIDDIETNPQFAGITTSNELNTKKGEVEAAIDAQADALKDFDTGDKDPAIAQIAAIKSKIDAAVQSVSTYLSDLELVQKSDTDVSGKVSAMEPLPDVTALKTIEQLQKAEPKLDAQLVTLNKLRIDVAKDLPPLPSKAAKILGNLQALVADAGPVKTTSANKKNVLNAIDKKIEEINQLKDQISDEIENLNQLAADAAAEKNNVTIFGHLDPSKKIDDFFSKKGDDYIVTINCDDYEHTASDAQRAELSSDKGMKIKSNSDQTFEFSMKDGKPRATLSKSETQAREGESEAQTNDRLAETLMTMMDNIIANGNKINIKTKDPLAAQICAQYLTELKSKPGNENLKASVNGFSDFNSDKSQNIGRVDKKNAVLQKFTQHEMTEKHGNGAEIMDAVKKGGIAFTNVIKAQTKPGQENPHGAVNQKTPDVALPSMRRRQH